MRGYAVRWGGQARVEGLELEMMLGREEERQEQVWWAGQRSPMEKKKSRG